MNKKIISQASRTNWKYLDGLNDKNIDFSDSPELTPEMFANAVVRKNLKLAPARKTQVTLRIDTDVLEWFKKQGRGYQTRINALLKAYVEAIN
jgi:uncharacterized protein (DUF4415 family)